MGRGFGYLIPHIQISAWFCIVCRFSILVGLIVFSGTGGYSRMGLINVLYSLSFIWAGQEENLLSFIS